MLCFVQEEELREKPKGGERKGMGEGRYGRDAESRKRA